MAVLSIISCEMLEDELTHVLSEDKALTHLILVDAVEIQGLARKLRAKNRPFLTADLAQIPNLVKTRRNTQSFSPMPTRTTRISDAVSRLLHGGTTSDAVVANVLEVGLHADGELLKREVCRNIERMSSFSDGILVLYGVCDSLRDIELDCAECPCPLYFLTDENGTKVEDCIALALGGNRFRWQIANVDRDVVFFLTPMWASKQESIGPDSQKVLNYHSRMNARIDQQLIQSIERLLKHTLFKKVAKVNTGLRYEPSFDENVRDYAQARKLNVVQLEGNMDIVERCYQKAKSSIRVRS